jgi:hypothetical protein
VIVVVRNQISYCSLKSNHRRRTAEASGLYADIDHANGKPDGLRELRKELRFRQITPQNTKLNRRNGGTQQMALLAGPCHDRELPRDCQIHFDETKEAPILPFSSLSHCHSLDES